MINLEGFSDETRIWIYQADKKLTAEQVTVFRKAIKAFAHQWVSHNRALKSFADLLHDRFVILAVDETMAGASGCSIDASVHFLKNIQSDFGIDLFDRMRFSFVQNGEISTVDRPTFSSLFASGDITDETLVVDTLINKKKDLDQFIKPLKQSWHRRMV